MAWIVNARAVRALVLFAVMAPPGVAQKSDEPEISSMLSSGLVKLGAEVQWVLQVRGATSAELIEVPEVDGLLMSAPDRPSISRQSFYRNGRSYSFTDYSWAILIRPSRLDEFTIPAARLRLDGREFLTDELTLKVVRDMRGEELGYFEATDVPRRIYEGQPFELDLSFGWDAKLGVQRARLILPWWQRLRGVVELSPPPRDLSTQEIRFGLNSRSQIQVEEVPAANREGTEHRAFRLRRRFLATRAGTLEFPESYLEFAELSGTSRLGQTYDEYYVHLPALSVEVLAVPEEGRPFEWTGAVGEFFVDRRVDRRDVDVGDSIKLTVSWTGTSNLEFFEPPDLSRVEGFEGFRQLGLDDQFLGDERRVTYDLVPTSPELTEIPPVPLWIFDPAIEGWRKVESESVPIRVRALAKSSELEAEGEAREVRDIRDIDVHARSARALRRPGAGAVGGALVLVPVLWLLARTLVRRRGDPDAPAERRRRRARRRLARELASAKTPAEQSAALQTFLAGRTGEQDAAWLGRDAVEWARERAVDLEPELVEELAGTLEELDRHTWGVQGPSGQAAAAVPRERLLALADRLVRGGLA